MATTPEFITKHEAAAILACSVDTVRRRVADGSLPAYRLGGRVLRFKRDDVYRLLHPVPTAR